MTDTNPKTWDIFCRVVDNYGDIGVCWRLARQLANEHSLIVRLWVDEIAALQQIWPDTTLSVAQNIAGVQVCIWDDDAETGSFATGSFATDYVADVVIEAFACHLPDTYLAKMKLCARQPHWFNLEYLSAEPWVEGCHQLTSMHPQNGLKKTYFFPGFSAKTGGLLRERNLLIDRDDFILTEKKNSFFQTLGITGLEKNTLVISLFSYENIAITSLMKTWSLAQTPIVVIVPVGRALTSINTGLNLCLREGEQYTLGALNVRIIPFLTQTDYDKLLWSCDINFVRGEDSFVRAQWAAKPFIWNIYPQDDAVHLVKLKAFLDKHTATAEYKLANAISQLWINWNTAEDCSDAWNLLANLNAEWRKQNQDWSNSLRLLPELAGNLVDFCQKAL